MNRLIILNFLIISTFWGISLCDDKTQAKAEITKNNIKNAQQINNVLKLQNKWSGNDQQNNIGAIPINRFGVARGGKIGNILIDDDKNNKMPIFGGNYVFDFDAGNPGIHGEIRRPCQVYDTFCIRKFFAEHSKCKISGRPLPDPLFRAQGTYYVGSANITGSQTDAVYGGLNDARITEFYINKATDNLVIAITFNNATKYSNDTFFKYHLRGREPVVTRDAGGIQYGVVTTTVIIPQIQNLNLGRSEVYTYGDNSMFAFALGPGIATSADPEVATMYAFFFTNIPTEYQEEIASLGSFIAANYIQYNICDFGLKVL